MQRVISYIDGFNLYYGLRSQSWRRYFWLDVQALSRNLLRPDQSLVHTKYFTARISSPTDKVKRQSTYIDAIQTLTDVSIYLVNTRRRHAHAANADLSTIRHKRR